MPRFKLRCEACGASFVAYRGPNRPAPRFCCYRCYWDAGGPRANAPNYQQKAESGEAPRGRKQVYVGRDKDGRPRYRRRSHVAWESAHPSDPVLPGEHIHHADHDPTNDDPGNLVKFTAEEHARHHAGIITASERSRRMKAYHAANPGRQRKGSPRTCLICGVEFYRPPSAKAITCSYACMAERMRREQRR